MSVRWSVSSVSIAKGSLYNMYFRKKPYCNTQKHNDWKHQESHWGRCPLDCKDQNMDVDSDQNMAGEVMFYFVELKKLNFF